jgi:amidase
VAKDLFALAGHTSSFGSACWRDSHSPSDATAPAIDRLLGAGAELVGLAKLDALAYSLVGNAGEGTPPRNPRWPERFTGGSSSGPAAAVAGGLADLGLGSDTAGSIRVPAAACGLCSIRPTHGTIPVDGMLPLAPSFDTVGVLARDPALLRRAFDVLASAFAVPATPLSEVLLAADTLAWVDPDVAHAVARTAETIASTLGCTVRHVDLSAFTSVETAERFARVQGREIRAQHGEWVDAHLDCFLHEVQVRLNRCRVYAAAPASEQAADMEAWHRYRGAFAALLGPGSCVVLPVLHDVAPWRDASDADLVAFRSACFRLTAPSSLAGAPEVVVPVPHDGSEQTYGVGLVGAPGADRSLLDAAVALGAAGALDL